MAIADLVTETAQAEGVDPRLALELAIEESGLKQDAVSPTGAIGVMQLEPATAAELGVDPSVVEQNILGGVRYLKQQLERFGDPVAALAAYNWGPSRVTNAIAQWGSGWLIYAPAETRGYVTRILDRVGSAYQVNVAPIDAVTTAAAAASRQAVELAAAVPADTWKGIALLVGLGLGLWVLEQSL
jgi:soluble lytic murein transglycosylase-like protein